MSQLGKTARPASRASSATPSSAPNTAPNTRKKTQNAGPTTREEAISKAPGDVRSPEKAMEYLSAHGYAPHGAPLSLHTIAFILFQLAAATASATDSNGMKAVAFLLEEIEVHGMAEELTERLTAKIDAKVEEVAKKLISAKEQEMEYLKEQRGEIQTVRREVIEAAKLLTESKDELDGTTNSLENAAGGMAELFTTSLQSLTERLSNITPSNTTSTAPTTAPTSHPTPLDTFSYAAATRQHLPVSHVANIARNNEKRRQFTIHPTDQEGDMGLGALTEMEIIEKLKLAFETMTVEKEVAPQDIRFSSVRRMKKGGVSFDVNSDGAATWLRNPDTQRDFTRHFSATAVVQGYQFRVLAEFVPISFNAEATYAIQTLEEANYLSAGSITELGWVKKAARRSVSQSVAHLKISFANIDQANEAIEKGLCIEGKGVNVRQMIVEPQRCAKCQLYGHAKNKGAPHFARDCMWTHDVCGLCGGMHRTSVCTAQMPEQAECANCKMSGRGDFRGHSVHSRTCPIFTEMKNRYDNKHGSQKYRYFVTDDVKTWETTQATEVPYDTTQNSQDYPAPPPNQRQLHRPIYARPDRAPQDQPAQPQYRAPADRNAPRGIQVSLANRVPLGRQGNLNRYLQISETLNDISENDAIAREIEAYDGLPWTTRKPPASIPAIPDTTLDWAEMNAPTGLPDLTSLTQTQPPKSPIASISRSATLSPSPFRRTSSSPLCFPSSAPATTPKTVSS